jgi:hypothetical protein
MAFSVGDKALYDSRRDGNWIEVRVEAVNNTPSPQWVMISGHGEKARDGYQRFYQSGEAVIWVSASNLKPVG